MNKICQLMAGLVERGGSDLHLTGDTPAYYRVQDRSCQFQMKYMRNSLREDSSLLLGKDKLDKTISDKELDCSYTLENVARFRINVFYDRESGSSNESAQLKYPYIQSIRSTFICSTAFK